MLNFTKRNFFIGVRTPWTLADEKIWEKTNRLAGRLFWVCGVLALLGLVAQGDLRLWLLVGPAVVAAIAACLYSLWEYLKTKAEGKARKEKVGFPFLPLAARAWREKSSCSSPPVFDFLSGTGQSMPLYFA